MKLDAANKDNLRYEDDGKKETAKETVLRKLQNLLDLRANLGQS